MSSPVAGIIANYTDPLTGANFPTAWLDIRQINYRPAKSCLVIVDVYESQGSYEGNLEPIFRNILPPVEANTPAFSTYFDIPVMRQADHDIETQAIAYITSIYQ